MYTLDTNAIIYFLKGDDAVRRALIDKFVASPIFVSTITEIELFAYPGLGAEEEGAINTFIARRLLVPVDSRIARLAGSFKRVYNIRIISGLKSQTKASPPFKSLNCIHFTSL